jgi:murein DD-endopeptidase MepM/ murein hydrolase activator NlpD
VAVGPCRVVAVGNRGAYGLLVEVDHGEGWTTRYAHLDSTHVEVGDLLYQGELVGRVGSTGNATGPHLHFEIRLDGAAVDPFEVLP